MKKICEGINKEESEIINWKNLIRVRDTEAENA